MSLTTVSQGVILLKEAQGMVTGFKNRKISDKLLEINTYILELELENSTLDKKNKELNYRNDNLAEAESERNCYYLNGNGPYCMTCFDSDYEFIRLPFEDFINFEEYFKNKFEKEILSKIEEPSFLSSMFKKRKNKEFKDYTETICPKCNNKVKLAIDDLAKREKGLVFSERIVYNENLYTKEIQELEKRDGYSSDKEKLKIKLKYGSPEYYRNIESNETIKI